MRTKANKQKDQITRKIKPKVAESWTVYWDEYTANTYTYGSEITFTAVDDVEVTNSLMPPGTVIKRWLSKANYQATRIEPTLPIIDGERQYRIQLNVTSHLGDCFLRLVYFDRYDVEIGSLIVRDGVKEFSCPIRTYSYSVQLISSGITHFHFHSIVIEELENTSYYSRCNC